MARVVLDPNVLVSGLITPHEASAQLLTELRAGSIELVTSPHLLVELESVLRRPKFRRCVTLDEVAVFVELIREESVTMDDAEPPARPLSSDPGDEYLVTLARSAKVDALVSGDPHLTRLRKIIPVRTPTEFLAQLRGRSGDQD